MERIYRRTVLKNLNEPDYYDIVVCLPDPDILVCEVKWALRSTAIKLVDAMTFQQNCSNP